MHKHRQHYGNKLLLESIRNTIPQKFFRDVMNDLHSSYKVSYEYIKNYSHSTAKDLLPHLRRANFEDKIPQTARNHNLEAYSVLNKTRNASHTEIITEVDSKKLIITSLAVPDRFNTSKLRAAQFRKTLAEESQLFLLPELNEFMGLGDGYYGLILHGANYESRDKVDFAYLGFPTANCKEWYGNYNLLELAGMVSDTEVINDNAIPKLRKHIIRKER